VTEFAISSFVLLTTVPGQTRPGDTAQLMALMQEVQEYGQPPSDIIREIAPGLELDANGLPKMNGVPGGGDGDECRIM
jgi:peroxin-19